MEQNYSKAVCALFKLAKQDKQYAQMNLELKELEQKFSEIIMKLPDYEQDVAWAFVCDCENMNRRMLEIIFEKLDFLRDYME